MHGSHLVLAETDASNGEKSAGRSTILRIGYLKITADILLGAAPSEADRHCHAGISHQGARRARQGPNPDLRSPGFGSNIYDLVRDRVHIRDRDHFIELSKR